MLISGDKSSLTGELSFWTAFLYFGKDIESSSSRKYVQLSLEEWKKKIGHARGHGHGHERVKRFSTKPTEVKFLFLFSCPCPCPIQGTGN
jgi:hypothetical protein